MNHKELDVWKESMELVKDIYKITSVFPKEELYGLTSQVRRSAVSIPSNIAEGSARSSDKEFVQFLYISLSSLAEVETQIIIARELGFIKDIKAMEIRINNVKKYLLGLIKYLKSKKLKSEK